MSFTPEQVQLLDANHDLISCCRLFQLTVEGQTFRLAESLHPITTLDGQTWQPGLRVIEAQTPPRATDFEAVPAEYVIAALPANPDEAAADSFAAMARAIMQDSDKWFGAPISQSLQLLSDHVPVGPPIMLHRGWIRDVQAVESLSEARFRIRAESLFERRNITPLGEYTDRDQQRRSPGDRGCEFVAAIEHKVIEGWPI